MKNTLLFIFLCYFGIATSQTIHDKTFHNVIIIENDDVISNEKDYMLRFPIKTTKGTLIIFNNCSYLPAKTFFKKESFLAKQNKIILITPDWNYLKSIRDSDRKTGYHSTPVRQNKMYQIDRVKNTVDSIKIIEEYLEKPNTYNFAKSYSKDFKPIYIEECSNKNGLVNNVKNFEKENNIPVTSLINQNSSSNKKNNCMVLTFDYDNYDYQQRVNFINLLRYLSDDKNKYYPKVFLPIKLYDGNKERL